MSTTETTDPRQVIEQEARERLSPGWKIADVHPHYPASNREVIELCSASGYICSVETINEFIDKGYMQPPQNQGGRMCWSACDICCLLAALENRERWKPAPNKLHDAKKTAYRIQTELSHSVEAKEEMLQATGNYTLEDLLLMLKRDENPAVRQLLHECVLVKLETMGVEI
ncbi:hypothetical protein Pla110_29170 [Polystyrenella longa]|uniref:Uncharacterized protein n=1 Tax=Polystyrenella longa TaxID=2528007 RepID=A0A518CPN0_9PLAN|nr:hypothetical protein [Polystyrenella longa]QDU81179.1 hypothetical protein Pla110_29170 [Polystyrenella longa]